MLQSGQSLAERRASPRRQLHKLLALTGMNIQDFNIIEINKTFACWVVYSMRELDMRPEERARVNHKDGATAISHPLRMTGTRQAAVIAHEMVRRNLCRELAGLYVGGGQGMATALEHDNYV